MATVEPYTLKGGQKRYLVQFRTPDRRLTKKRGFKTKKAAQAFASTVELSVQAGTFVDPAAGNVTISELFEKWRPSQDLLAPRTRRNNLSSYSVHVEPVWGNWAVNRITTPEVRKWVAEMQAAGKKRDTILRAIHVLRAIVETAVEARYLTANPVQKIKVPRETRERPSYLTVDQVETLAGSFDDEQHKTAIFVMAYCGLRISELAALDARDFDPVASRLNVSKAMKDYGKIGPTKTYEQRRVPVPNFVALRLAKLVAEKAAREPMFTSPEGARLDVDNFRLRVFKPGAARARERWAKEWPNAEPFPNVRPHGLRHTCASFAIRTGANVKAVQALLGHESAAVTLDIYSDLFPDDLDQVGAALGELRDTARSGTDVAKM